MPIALSVRKGQPVAAVLGRADGIGIIFVLSSFRMVSIHDIFLRFDLNFGNSNRDGGLRQPTLSLKKRRYSKTHLQSGRSRKASAFNSLLKWHGSSASRDDLKSSWMIDASDGSSAWCFCHAFRIILIVRPQQRKHLTNWHHVFDIHRKVTTILRISVAISLKT